MQLINTESNFSYYNNLLSAKEPDNDFDINQLIETIKYGSLKAEIEKIRNEKVKAKRSVLKQRTLPCVTLSGTFKLRNKKNLIEHSGLMQIDIDEVDNYNQIYQTLINDEYTYVAFKSPSGNGIKLIVKVNPSVETHLEQFLSLQKYYLDEYNIVIDDACKDISRCMLLSYDPLLYCNPLAEMYIELYIPKSIELPKKNTPIKYTFNINSNNDVDIIENITNEIERNHIDITNGYMNWIKIGFSLASTLGENGRDYYHRLSKYNEDYSLKQCDKKFTNLLIQNNNSISLGSLIHIARENGIEVKFSNYNNQKDASKINETKDLQIVSLSTLLKKKRLELANKIGKPAFTVFTNKTLDALVECKPQTINELMKVKGFGEKKCEKYGEDVLLLIKNSTEAGDLKNERSVQKYTLPKLNSDDQELYDSLRSLRLVLAKQRELKAFRIFSNSTLDELVKNKPKNKKELLQIKGIGIQKQSDFGNEIIEITSKCQV